MECSVRVRSYFLSRGLQNLKFNNNFYYKNSHNNNYWISLSGKTKVQLELQYKVLEFNCYEINECTGILIFARVSSLGWQEVKRVRGVISKVSKLWKKIHQKLHRFSEMTNCCLLSLFMTLQFLSNLLVSTKAAGTSKIW